MALTPIDLRWSFDRLAGIAEEQLGRRARSGAFFVFFGKRRTSLKAVSVKEVVASIIKSVDDLLCGGKSG